MNANHKFPIPEDDGAANHLQNSGIPSISLPNQEGNFLSLNRLDTFRMILYFFPMTGRPDMPLPENWNLIEDLANSLGAATACSKPVSDMGWRPHSEHFGQTGKPVATNLYIAIGISGAIQHLAGINSSKIKVVINNDPEAPFFKAADYGIVGDAFDVVPRLNEKLKEFKAQNS